MPEISDSEVLRRLFKDMKEAIATSQVETIKILKSEIQTSQKETLRAIKDELRGYSDNLEGIKSVVVDNGTKKEELGEILNTLNSNILNLQKFLQRFIKEDS